MKIAVLGANGMLGARVCEEFQKAGHKVFPITRQQGNLAIQSHVTNLAVMKVEWIVNCAGIVKSREKNNPIETVLVNAAMPHWLEAPDTVKILHVSTDCVFSGSKGMYVEGHDPDPVDLYGTTKLAGELGGRHSITVRTSFIGWENGAQRGLLEWFVRQRNVSGYRNALWSGLSAREVARALIRVVANAHVPGAHLYHLAGKVISKYDLLWTLNQAMNLEVGFTGADEPFVNRSLCGAKFSKDFQYEPPSWSEMAEELARERPT